MISFLLRLPDDLHTQLKEWANSEKRSLHSHIIYLLEQAVKGRTNGKA